MSATVSSSSSPAASPRAAFCVSSPRLSLQRSPASHNSSPRSRTYPAHPARRLPTAAPSASSPRPALAERGLTAGAFLGYTSRGTQYSPDGFPPTADRKVAADAGKRSAGAGSARKRKEAALPASDTSSERQMSTSESSSSGALHPHKQSSEASSEASARPGSTPSSLRAQSLAATAADTSDLQEARSTHGHSAAPKRSRREPGTDKTMPLKYETSDPKDLGILIANMLMELIRINDRIPLRDGRLTRFHSRAPPGISVLDYLQRLIQHATLSPPILLSMVYYIDRLCTMYPAFTINSLTVHRFLITAATVAAKGLSDSFWTNPTYARIGGIPVSELATLELELLQRVQWKIVPKPEILEEYYASLVDRADGYILEGSFASGSESTSLDESDAPARGSTQGADQAGAAPT